MTVGTEIGIVGAGIVGLSAGYALTRRGCSVTIYERGVPGNGQSGGDSRIFRYLHDDPRLTAFARRSLLLWREWEQRCGQELVSRDGVLALGPELDRRCQTLVAAGVRARLIDAGEAADVLPILARDRDDRRLLLDEDGGVIRTRAAVEFLRAQLAERIVLDEVLSVRPSSSETAELRRGDERVEHGQVLVCAGIGNTGLAHGAGIELPLRPSLHVRLAFALRARPAPRLACLLDASTGDHAYGDPLPGNGSYAVGVAEAAVHPDGGLVDPDGLAEAAARTVAYVSTALPGLDPDSPKARHCWVTELDWATDAFALFSVGRVGFLAGQNLFKHAPAIGEELAAAVLGEPAAIDLSPAARLGAAP